MNAPPTEPKLRVLLADDYDSMLVAWRRLLHPKCDIVGSVRDGGELLHLALRLKPDVILHDLGMVQMQAAAICRRINQALPETRVVLVSATDDPRMRGTAECVGAATFVEKSAALVDLHRAIGVARRSDSGQDHRE